MPAFGPFVQTLASQKSNGTLFNTFTTAKSVINATELIQVPGGYWQVGNKVRIRAWGGLSNIVTTPGTVSFQVQMGSTSPATIIGWTSGALQMIATAETLAPFELEITLRLDTAGSGTAAKWMGGGKISALNVTLTAGNTVPTTTPAVLPAPATAPADGTGWESTIPSYLDFFAAFSISNAGNGVQLYDYDVVQLA